jgi:hypothetical protein
VRPRFERPKDERTPECQDCGACCVVPDPFFIELDNVDFAQLTEEEQLRLTTFEDDMCILGKKGGRCAALRIQEGRFLCAIYERRPYVCREFERGSSPCIYDRSIYFEAHQRLLRASLRRGAERGP